MLLDLIERHRGAFEYDWRARFHKPLRVVGTRKMSYGEAIRLTDVLAQDPSSQVCAAINRWDFPATREWMVLADLWDAASPHSYKKPKPYPRPWPKKRTGPAAHITQEDILAALRRAGHTAPLPQEV